jgi:hypothetical protein
LDAAAVFSEAAGEETERSPSAAERRTGRRASGRLDRPGSCRLLILRGGKGGISGSRSRMSYVNMPGLGGGAVHVLRLGADLSVPRWDVVDGRRLGRAMGPGIAVAR